MNDIHQPIILPKIGQRLPFNDIPSASMMKLERGLVQRSLLYCFEKGYFSFIRYLLQSGTADARERDHEGRTGLMYCCFIDNDCWAQNIAIILLEYGAKIEDEDQRGLNALHYAIITQRLILIRRYLASLDFNLNRTIDIHGNTCLHYACSTGNVDTVRLILNAMKRYESDLMIKNHSGSTAYDIACQLNHERCRNLLRNEIILSERQNLKSISTTKTNISRLTDKSFVDRRSSVLPRMRPITSTTHRSGSFTSAPVCNPNSKKFHKRCPSITSINNENTVHPPSIFIDPIESRNMSLKRNEPLDVSLTNHAKTRSDFVPLPFVSQSTVFNSSSSSTWRDDFTKVIDQFQTFKTPSYRKTAHPPLNNELSCELFEKLYGMGGADGHDCSNHQPLSSLPTDLLHKDVRRRRSSTISNKSIHKMKK